MRSQNHRGRTAAITFGLVCLWMASPAWAFDINGFLRQKGKGDIALSYTDESYDEFWAGKTKVSDPGLGEVDTKSLSMWLAYGITDRLTLIASLPWVDTEGDGTAGFAERDLQDLSVLGAYRIASVGSRVHSEFVGAIGIRTPASNYEPNLPVSVGDGTTDALLRFVYQLQRGRFYFSQQVGYDIRSEEAPDGVPLYTEVGYTQGRTTFNLFFAKLMANDGTDIGDPGFTFPSNRDEYERLGAKVFVRVTDRFGVAVGYFDTLDGRNSGDSSGVSIGVDFGF